tara:strand:+ start:2692 stop:2922 length:231 start_codon:yes stop_codon:yes gene_type:complete
MKQGYINMKWIELINSKTVFCYKGHFYSEWIELINSKFDKIIDDSEKENNELNHVFINDFKLLKKIFNTEFRDNRA